MSTVFLVKEGKSFLFPYKMKTLAAFDTIDEAHTWIHQNIQPGQHMYIDQVEKINKRELRDIMRTHEVIPIKGD